MTDDKDSLAWHAVNALIEDAKLDLRGEHGEAFAWAIYNAIRATDQAQLENLSQLLRRFGIEVRKLSTPETRRPWIN